MHLDLKPQNLVLSEPDGLPVILDIGIARLTLAGRTVPSLPLRLGLPVARPRYRLSLKQMTDYKPDVLPRIR